MGMVTQFISDSLIFDIAGDNSSPVCVQKTLVFELIELSFVSSLLFYDAHFSWMDALGFSKKKTVFGHTVHSYCPQIMSMSS